MKTLKNYSILIAIFVFLLSVVIIAQQKESFDIEKAKAKYIDAKCNTCHALSDFGIEAKNKSASNKAPDLSKIKIEYDKDFLRKYLNKEESINNKKHPVAYKGTEEELNLIAALLLLHKQNDEKQE